MPLIIIFGINASGKDSITNILKETNSEIFVTTESRLLMYHLGIIKHFNAAEAVSKEEYKSLENTSQEQILAITNTKYKESLEIFKKSNKITLILSHLVFLLHIDKDPVFLTEKRPSFSGTC